MRIIAFQYTTPAVQAGAKSCTRRVWAPRYAALHHAGDFEQAWDRSPRVHGQRFGTIRLTADPVLEPLSAMPDSDYEAEGFAWLHEHQAPAWPGHFPDWSFAAFTEWRQSGAEMWVVRFELVEAIGPL